MSNPNGTAKGTAAFRRVLLKVSGEALMGDRAFGIDPDAVQNVARQIGQLTTLGIEVAVVCGGGNFVRGATEAAKGMDRATADYMGMLAILLNAIPLQETLEKRGIETRVLTAIPVQQIAEPYIRRRAIRHMEKGRVVVFAGGAGLPYITSDTAAALRALEINADAILMAKNGVDGVYDRDPNEHADATLIPEITHADAISKGIRVMDSTALTLCGDNNLPLYVFDMDSSDNIVRIATGERIGTIVQTV